MTTTRSARRVAVLSDVHANAVALAAVLDEIERLDERPDLLAFGGDLTWGPLPRETYALVRGLSIPAIFVRGNAERALLEPSDDPSDRERWMRERHTDEMLAFLETFVRCASVDVAGLGPVCFCHGSPRSDIEFVSPATPAERMLALTAGIDEKVLVTAHNHIQFDRHVAGIRSLNAGSVGMPYEVESGAYWALLGPDVEFRRTPYPLEEAEALYRQTDDPRSELMVQMLYERASHEEVIEHCERLVFAE